MIQVTGAAELRPIPAIAAHPGEASKLTFIHLEPLMSVSDPFRTPARGSEGADSFHFGARLVLRCTTVLPPQAVLP